MGAQGIRRRKPRHDITDTVDAVDPGALTEGDTRRLFGRFTWDAYTPAGNLERNGFFLRQLSRNGTRGAWSFVAQAKWVFAAIAVVVGSLVLVGNLLRW